MKETIDWEAMMTGTEQSAKAAARNAERTIGGVAEVLETQRRHSSELGEIKATLRAMEENERPRRAPQPTVAARRPTSRPAALLWGLAGVFAAGVACGAFFAR